MKVILFFFVVLAISASASSQQIIATLDITAVEGSVSNPGPGFFHPVVVRNTQKNEWLVVWTKARSEGSRGTTYGRLVSDDGQLGAQKTLKTRSIIDDLEYDPDHDIYMAVLFGKGFEAQAYQSNLAKKGKSTNLSSLFRPQSLDFPDLLYRPESQDFLLLASAFPCTGTDCYYNVEALTLNSTGKPTSARQVVLQTGADTGLRELHAFRNPQTTNTLLLLVESDRANFDHEDVVAYFVKPDFTLVGNKSLKVGSNSCTGSLNASAAFNKDGSALTSWIAFGCDGDGQQTKARLIKSTEKGLRSTKSVAKGDYPQNGNGAIAGFYDEVDNQYVVIWHDGPLPATGPGTLLGAKINAATGRRIGEPFTLATFTLDPAAWVTGISVSYDSASRKALLVYSENALGAIFQVRGVLFEVD